MAAKFSFDGHLDEQVLEEYWFDRLPESSTSAVEEHLLVCPTCQSNLQSLEEYILLMKLATADVAVPRSSGPQPSGGPVGEQVRAGMGWPGFAPRTVWVSVVGLLSAVAVVTFRNEATPTASAVPLVAVRSGEEGMPHAPAGRPLDLSIDVTDLATSDTYRLEVVNKSGQRIWERMTPASNGKLSALLPKSLKAGVYWVRLYSPPGVLIREFGLRLE